MNAMNDRIDKMITPLNARNFLDVFLKSPLIQSPRKTQPLDQLDTDMVVKKKKKKLYKRSKKPVPREVIEVCDSEHETVDVKPFHTKQEELNIEDQITNFVLHKDVLEPDKDNETIKLHEEPFASINKMITSLNDRKFLDVCLKPSIIQSPKETQSSDQLDTDFLLDEDVLEPDEDNEIIKCEEPCIEQKPLEQICDSVLDEDDLKPDKDNETINSQEPYVEKVTVEQIIDFLPHEILLKQDKDNETIKSREEPYIEKRTLEVEENTSQTIRFVFLEPQEMPMLIVETSKFEPPKHIVFTCNLQPLASKWLDCNCCVNSKWYSYKKTYTCPYCPYKSDDIYKLQHHKSEFHNLILPLIPCQNCDFKARTSLELQSHTHVHYELVRRTGTMYCDLCSLSGPNYLTMQRHFKKQHLVFQVPYIQCDLCPNQNASMKYLQVHSIMCHKFDAEESCFKLGIRSSITVPQSSCVHKIIMNGIIKTLCVFCTFYSEDEEQVLEHIIIDHNLIRIV